MCWGVGGGGVCGKMWGRWSVWKNVGEVWESVLGCRGSSLKRGVGEVRRGGGVKKCGGGVRKCVAGVEGGKIWGRCGKVCWVWQKVKRNLWEKVKKGVGKCIGVQGK